MRAAPGSTFGNFGSLAEKHEQVSREGIESPLVAHDGAQTIVATAHVHWLGREHDAHAAR
jgi:hypothetical protein